ncbi:MAG: hypothetical protein EOP24_48160, partial [Hyphomicrobiales bacterium]
MGVLAGSCTPSAPGVLPVITCIPNNSTGPTAVASCSPSDGLTAPFITTTCWPAETSTPERVTSCIAAEPSLANGFVKTTCEAIKGNKIQTKTLTLTNTYTVSGSTVIPGTDVAGPPVETDWRDDNAGLCYIDVRPPTIDQTAGWKQSTTDFADGCTAWPCLGPVTGVATGGSSNSLADVAQYYYVTDLRPTIPGANPDLGKNDVPKL